MRLPTPAPPDELLVHDGLATALFLPADAIAGGVVVLHGAGSCKERHFDFGRAARAHGLAAAVFDQRGHGESSGELGAGAAADVAAVAGLLRERGAGAVGLRGSSMGATVALLSAQEAGAAAVVAICPATPELLLRGLAAGAFDFHADADGLAAWLREADLEAAARGLGDRLLLLHAEGDEQVPIAGSRALAEASGARLVAVPGGHHRSIQHDAELQGAALRHLVRQLAAA